MLRRSFLGDLFIPTILPSCVVMPISVRFNEYRKLRTAVITGAYYLDEHVALEYADGGTGEVWYEDRATMRLVNRRFREQITGTRTTLDRSTHVRSSVALHKPPDWSQSLPARIGYYAAS